MQTIDPSLIGHHMKASIAFVLMFIAFNEAALADEKYQFCSIAGFFYGAGDDFTASLAERLKLRDRELLHNRACTAIHQQAYRVGEKMGSRGTVDPTDYEIVMPALQFKEKIQNSILRSAGY